MLDSEQTFYKLKETILKNEHFEDTDNTDPIKLIHKGAIELDLLPFGDIEDSSGEVTISQPKTFVINMPGFKELLPHTETIQIGEQELNVCSLEGIIILKLLAYNDRPERTKDLDDINHIISVYFDMNANEIYDEHHAILAIYEDIDGEDYERHVSARIIGRKIAGLLTANYELLKKIKDQIPFGSPPDPIWLALEEGINDIIQ